jgi:predicted component of type VI protein secretion system
MDASAMGTPQPPAAAAPVPNAKLVLLREDGSEGGYLVLDANPKPIGRNHGAPFDSDVYLDLDHATVSAAEGGIRFDDSGSLNGICYRLEGKTDLQHGDQFRIGQELLLYEDLPEPEAAPDGTERMGSPNPGYWGRVRLLIEADLDAQAVPIEGDELVIGREDGGLTFPEDGYVSGSHARVYGDADGVYLEDLQSSNGTYVRVRAGQVLPYGTMALVGQQLFRIDQA